MPCHEELNARRMLCPLPVIRTQDKIREMDQGDILTVICTDPGALNDIPAWCRINQHEIVSADSIEGEVIITIRVC